jgi:adenine deaminase
MTDLKEKILTAYGEIKPDIIFTNAGIVNVFTGELEIGDVAVKDDTVVGIGKYGNREKLSNQSRSRNTDPEYDAGWVLSQSKVIDCKGKFICPGFIDGHIHIESSMLTPKEFAKVVIQHGTTGVITDPHEIVNVAGSDGLYYMLNESEGLPVDIYVMLPSCVPATKLDESGAIMGAEELEKFIDHKRVLGLAEVMDYYGVIKGDKELINKINLTLDHGKTIDGHAPGIKGREINAYVTAGITSDHECSNATEAIDKIRRGLWIMVREGTAAKNMEALKPLLLPPYCRRSMLVTDDKHPGDLLYEGHMDALIKKAIKLGANPLTAIIMATLNPATYFGLRNRGAVAPGYKADLVILKDLVSFEIEAVYKDGRLAFHKEEQKGIEDRNDIAQKSMLDINGENVLAPSKDRTKRIFESIQVQTLKSEDFYFKEAGSFMRVMELVPGELLTKERIYPIGKEIDYRKMSQELIDKDMIKLAVVERHHRSGHIGLGLLKGYGLLEGAVASSVAHDSHNLIVAGCNEEDMAVAANYIADNQGGLCIVKDKKILCELLLPVGGLMSEESAVHVDKLLSKLKKVGKSLGISGGIDPFMTLAFLSLSVIPELRLTSRGLLDVRMQELKNTFFD